MPQFHHHFDHHHLHLHLLHLSALVVLAFAFALDFGTFPFFRMVLRDASNGKRYGERNWAEASNDDIFNQDYHNILLVHVSNYALPDCMQHHATKKLFQFVLLHHGLGAP